MPTIADARREFTDLLGRAHYRKERVDITRRETPYAAIISAEEKEELERLDKFRVQYGIASISDLIDLLESEANNLPLTRQK